MDFLNYLQKYNAQEKINKLAKKYKNKRVVIYGAGQFAKTAFENYDLSKLNIVAIADKKFEQEGEHHFFNILDESILYGSKNAAVEIRPLINLEFKDLF